MVCGCFLLVIDPSWAMTRVFFTSQESVEKELIRLIDESHSSIEMALFRFASRPLAAALARARARNVRVRILLDGHAEANDKASQAALAIAGGELRRLDGKRGSSQGIMHHKFVLFDRRKVVTGSFNWTSGAEHVNYENALLTDDANVVSSYSREFERLWDRAIEAWAGAPEMSSPSAARKSRTISSSSSAAKKTSTTAKKKKRRRKKTKAS
jgi:phosphatidylserine/phosphatidylglycerophosphate/cardiolipin synthase-like enzyme